MILKKFISVLASVTILSAGSAAPVQAVSVENRLRSSNPGVAETYEIYKITFLDFDGNVLTTMDVEEGDPIYYMGVDVSSLHKHLNVNTEQDFSSWDIHPDFADKDYTIHALSKTATISVNKMPSKTRYYNKTGDVDLGGLDVSIKISVQTPQKDAGGKYITEDTVIDITSSCTASPSKLTDAFAKSDKASIAVYPPGDNKPLCQYDINYCSDLGDVNGDKKVDSTDASMVLTSYVNLAARSDYTLDQKFKKLADVDLDGDVNSRDASYILRYYAVASVATGTITWDDVIDYDNL